LPLYDIANIDCVLDFLCIEHRRLFSADRT